MFQLILQFAPWDDEEFDKLVQLEDQLSAVLATGAIDGHDLGSDEANIFIFTANPTESVQACLPAIEAAGLLTKFSAGYRDIGSEDYHRAWPHASSAPFTVK